MKRLTQNSTSGRRLIIPVLTILALTVLALPSDADAGIRVKVKTPVIKAVYSSGGNGHGISIQTPGHYRPVKITKSDRKIARKLSRQTRYSQGELLRLKRAGYTWRGVGRLLRIPRSLMQKVLHTKGCRANGRDFEIGWEYDSYGRNDRDVRVIHKNRYDD